MATAIQIFQGQNVQMFCDRTQYYLLQHEAEHNLLLAIQNTLAQHPMEEPLPYLGWCEANGAVQGVAVYMPRRNIVLSKMSAATAGLFAEDIAKAECQPPGVAGLTAEVQAFVEVWQQRTRQSVRLAIEMHIYQLIQVQLFSLAAGQLRVAEMCDRALVLNWSYAFDREAFGSVQALTEQIIDRQLQRGHIYLWHDGSPVSMAIGRGSNPGGGRIGPVYTPPEYRRRGYATACVAALSQRLLDQGYSSCFLFTDQANLTSNHIYRMIGYQRQCDWFDYQFTESAQASI
ncbi:MAG: GNAT family N-acetyltransferase [Thermosynechococcaceae cyanobacterium]